MRTRKEKPTHDVTPVKPMTINLQTRPFAPIDTEDSTPVTGQNKSSGIPFHGEDLFLKLINSPIQERSPSKNEVMRSLMRERFAKAIAQREMEATQVQAKQNIGEPNDKYEQKGDNTATKFRRPLNLSSEGRSVQRKEVEENPLRSLMRERFAKAIAQREMAAMQVQAKLNIGEPNDKYEQEADATAAKVVQQINSAPQGGSVQKQESIKSEDEELQMKPAISKIQRQESMEDEDELQMKPAISEIQRQESMEDEEELQMKSEISEIQRQESMEDEEELQAKSLVQRRENLNGGEASTDLESTIQSARGSGQALDPKLQEKMGQAMGADFSGVKVLTDAQSDQLNKSIQAKAFTTGQDLFFRQGAYEPRSRGGQELIAHELTHVVQQSQKQQISKSPDIQRKFAFNFKAQVGGTHKLDTMGHNAEFRDLMKTYENYQNATSESIESQLILQMETQIKYYKQTGDYKKTKKTLKSRDVDRLEQVIIAEKHKAEFVSLLKTGLKPNKKMPNNPAKLLAAGDFNKDTLNFNKYEMDKYIGPEDKKIEDILKAKELDSNAQGQNLDEAELLAIRLYTLQHYKYINPAMAQNDAWLKSVNEGSPSAKIADLTQVAKQGRKVGSIALSGLNKLKSENKILYRGEICLKDEIAARGHAKGSYPIKHIISCAEANSDEEGKHQALRIAKGLNSSFDPQTHAIIISKINAKEAVNIQDLHANGGAEKEWNIKPGGTKNVTSSKKRKGTRPGHEVYDVEWEEKRK